MSDYTPCSSPIFLVGSERSGSNLLRSLIGNHSMVEAPTAPHFFDQWSHALWAYGDLRVPANMGYLITDMVEYANHEFNNWHLQLDVEQVVAEQGPKSFWDAYDVVCRAKAAMHGKSIFSSKDNHIFNYTFQIKARWPDSKLLFLYRDPRDHCASWKQKPMHLKTVWDSISKWEQEQRLCLDLVQHHGVDMHFVSYEDLITDTPKVMSRALGYCGLPVEEACFQTDSAKQKATAERFVYWENLDKPIIRENAQKYRKTLTEEEINMIETKVGGLMSTLGYTCETKRNWRVPMAHAWRLRMERKKVETKDREHLEKELAILHSKVKCRNEIKQRAKSRAVVR